jgi:phosphoribosylglycinamide formyltransferase-1
VFKIIVLISGSGSNLEAIMQACEARAIDGNVVGVISNNADAFGLERAKKFNIPYDSRESFDAALVSSINRFEPNLIVLAGFMRILSPVMTSAFQGMMINIHPSLLPKYPGLNTHGQVIANKDTQHGVTVHSVSEELDAGPIVAQARISVNVDQKLDDLIERIHKAEHLLFPKVIGMIASGEINLKKTGLDQEVIYKNYEI